MSSVKRPDYEIHSKHKFRMKIQVLLTLLVATSLFALVLLPDELLTHVEKAVGSTWAFVIKSSLGIILAPALAMMLFSADSSFKGSGPTAKWVKSILPTTRCMEIAKFDKSDCDNIWFRYFDTWALARSPNQVLLQHTYHATYTARMVYYLKWSCYILFAASMFTMAANQWCFRIYHSPKDAWPHLLVTVIYGAAGEWLRRSNRIGSSSGESTGAWNRVEDVFSRSVSLLKHEVLAGTTSYTDAMEKIEAIRAKLLKDDNESAST